MCANLSHREVRAVGLLMVSWHDGHRQYTNSSVAGVKFT